MQRIGTCRCLLLREGSRIQGPAGPASAGQGAVLGSWISLKLTMGTSLLLVPHACHGAAQGILQACQNEKRLSASCPQGAGQLSNLSRWRSTALLKVHVRTHVYCIVAS